MTAVWVITTLVQVIDPDRQVPETVNYIFGIIVSSLFGVSVIRSRKGNGNGNGKNGGGEPHA